MASETTEVLGKVSESLHLLGNSEKSVLSRHRILVNHRVKKQVISMKISWVS